MNIKIIRVLGFAVIAAILGLGWLFVVSPYLYENGRLHGELEAAEQRQAQLQSEVTQTSEFQEVAEEVREYDVNTLIPRFPTTAESNELREQLYSLGVSAGVTVNVNTTVPVIIQASPQEAESGTGGDDPMDDPVDLEAPDESPAPETGEAGTAPEASSGNLAEVGLTITAEGSRSDITEFLYSIAEMERGILIENISTAGGADNDGEESYNLSVDAKTFLYREVPFPSVAPDEPEPVDDHEMDSEEIEQE